MKSAHPRLTLLFIFMLFGIPVVVAMLMHTSLWQYRPSGMTNRGTLIQPPVPVDFAALRFGTSELPVGPPEDQWVVLYPVDVPCINACLEDIESLRQIHRATGRRQLQLVIMPLAPPDGDDQTGALLEVYDAFRPAVDPDKGLVRKLQNIADTGEDGALLPGQAFLVDPSGNIMMRYAADFDPADLNKDLKRLLKLSEQDG